MSITARDRKILLVLAPLVIALLYWFMILGPKRDEASKLGEQLGEQEQKRDEATAQAERLTASQKSFRTEYASIVSLGKAVPSTVDMPGLILQLDKAAKGTGIHFTKIATGERSTAAPATPPPATTTGSTDPSAPAAPGGETAQSAPGKTVESAGDKVDDANKRETGLDPGDTKTSESAREGALPVGGGAASGAGQPGSPGAGPAGLDTVPLELTFSGSYFDLSDFFHRLKRFVRIANDRILVSGRLLTVDSFSFAYVDGKLTTDLKATVYLVPKAEGVAAGATPSGPSPGGTAVASADSGGAATEPATQVTP